MKIVLDVTTFAIRISRASTLVARRYVIRFNIDALTSMKYFNIERRHESETNYRIKVTLRSSLFRKYGNSMSIDSIESITLMDIL